MVLLLPTDSLDDDNTPLPELSFEDLLEPTADKSPQHMDIDTLDSEDEDVTGHELADDSLHTPQFKKLEQRPPTSGVTTSVLKSHAIKVVTSGTGLGSLAGTSASSKPQITEVKILNKLKPIPSSTVKIGNTIVSAATPGGVTKTLNNLTQIKTPDGRILYVQKSTPGTPTAAAKSVVAGPPPGGIRRLVAPPSIQKAVLSKGVTIAGSSLVKAAVPVKAGATGSVPITIKGITPLAGVGGKTTASPVTSPTSTSSAQPTKIHVVRTADGKIIKINQAGSSLLLNAKPQVGAAAGSASAGTTVNISPTNVGNVVVHKSVSQVVLKTAAPAAAPVKQVTATTGSVSSGTPGKMLVQSGGKQILVSSKNIIKLSPKPGATSAITNTGGAQGGSSTSGLHAVQLPGKGGVQYVRVLTSNKSAAGTSAVGTSAAGTSATSTSAAVPVPRAMPGQKITVVRSAAGVFTTGTAPSTSTAASTTSAPKANLGVSSNSNKIVMRTMGSIVPLPSMQTLVSKVSFTAYM